MIIMINVITSSSTLGSHSHYLRLLVVLCCCQINPTGLNPLLFSLFLRIFSFLWLIRESLNRSNLIINHNKKGTIVKGNKQYFVISLSLWSLCHQASTQDFNFQDQVTKTKSKEDGIGSLGQSWWCGYWGVGEIQIYPDSTSSWRSIKVYC